MIKRKKRGGGGITKILLVFQYSLPKLKKLMRACNTNLPQ